MTKQHFVALAAEFKNNLRNAHEEDVRDGGEHNRVRGVKLAISGFCHVAAQFNPRFDRQRFVEACGILNY